MQAAVDGSSCLGNLKPPEMQIGFEVPAHLTTEHGRDPICTRGIKVNFEPLREFEPVSIRPLMGVRGLYFISLSRTVIPYPFAGSRLVYIGMSEKRTNSVGRRLMGHYDGSSHNEGLSSYRKRENLLFTHLNFEVLERVWEHRVEDLESYFILDFVARFGVYPICNNKTGLEVKSHDLRVSLDIDWDFFADGQPT